MWPSSHTSLFNVRSGFKPRLKYTDSFLAWIRVIFCSGPRQVVNAMTLYSVLDDNLDPDATDAGQSLLQFFKNIGLLAEKDHQQAVILSGMLFTLVIWTFAALSLLLAVLFYILFLWHYIPNADGGLSGYCERKVNQKLTKIVSAKVNKALEDEERKKLKEARKAAGKQGKGEKPILGRQATLPMLLDSDNGDKLPQMPMLGRNDTMSTLPQYSSRPGTPSGQQPTLPGLELENLGQQRPYAPSRMGTKSSFSSVTSNAPLISNANEMGYGGRASPAPSLPQLDSQNGFPFPQRSMTASTSNTSFPRPGAGPPRGQTPLFRQQTQDGYYNASPSPFSDAQNARSQSPGPNRMDAYGRPIRGPTPRSAPAPYGVVEMPGSDNMGRNSPAPYPTSAAEMQGATPTLPFSSVEMPGSTPEPRIPDFAVEMAAPGSTPAPRFAELSSSSPGRSSPAPSQFNNSTGGRNSPILRMAMTASPAPMSAGGYQAFQPGPRSASAGPNGPPQGQQQRPSPGPQYRNMTEPMQRVGTPNGGPPGRVGTPQGGPMAPPRTGSGTYDPYNSNRQMSSGPGGGYRQ